MDTWQNHLRPGLDGRVCIYNYYYYYYYYYYCYYINKSETVNGRRTENTMITDWLGLVITVSTHYFFIVAVAFIDVQNVTKSIGSCKKKSLYNQPKPYFFKILLWSHFCIDFNKCYTETFGVVNILIVYLLIMLLRVIFICT